jgi:hypothetical protein
MLGGDFARCQSWRRSRELEALKNSVRGLNSVYDESDEVRLVAAVLRKGLLQAVTISIRPGVITDAGTAHATDTSKVAGVAMIATMTSARVPAHSCPSAMADVRWASGPEQLSQNRQWFWVTSS